MDRQYLAVKFRATDKRAYTYHNDGAPVSVGDKVKVPHKSGDGWNSAEVVATDMEWARPGETKGILGLVEPAARPLFGKES